MIPGEIGNRPDLAQNTALEPLFGFHCSFHSAEHVWSHVIPDSPVEKHAQKGSSMLEVGMLMILLAHTLHCRLPRGLLMSASPLRLIPFLRSGPLTIGFAIVLSGLSHGGLWLKQEANGSRDLRQLWEVKRQSSGIYSYIATFTS